MAFGGSSLLQGFIHVSMWLQVLGASSYFLGAQQDVTRKHLLLEAIDNHFGNEATTDRLAQLEEELSPIYLSLPKDKNGNLDFATVRYALHRFFLKEHGWLVHGLEPNGGAWNASSPTLVLKDRVPDHIYGLFEEHLSGRGFGLRELALLGTALERLVRIETMQRMKAMYDVAGLPTSAHLTEYQLTEVLEKNFMVYLFETNLSNAARWVERVKDKMSVFYPGWEDTQAWLSDTRMNIAYGETALRNPFKPELLDFTKVMSITEEVHDRFGKFQDMECGLLKNLLLNYEQKGSGRMRLDDFYGLALGGDWRFSETVDYLRQLGALDETAEDNVRLIIPNYIYGKSMCLAASSYYSVCCIDECNALLGHLEDTFDAPAVGAARLAAAIANLPSSTVSAPRNLSSALLGRLNEIAAIHSGMVPLHGRLFSQFLHHAFPRECPFPHLSGTTNPMTTQQWRSATGVDSTATKKQVADLGRELGNVDFDEWGETDMVQAEQEEDWEEPTPWSEEEELVTAWSPASREHSGWGRTCVRGLAMTAALFAVLGGLAKATEAARRGVAGGASGPQKQVFV